MMSDKDYLTFLSFGFFRFAAGDALRVDAAKIAEARSLLIPCLDAIFEATFLNPVTFLAGLSL